jgi:PAS domain S-box-containing protein
MPQSKAETTERELQAARDAQFRLLVEAVQDYAIFVLDPAGNVKTWNAGARRIKQYTASEIIGKHFSTFYPEEDKRNGKPQWELEVAQKEGRHSGSETAEVRLCTDEGNAVLEIQDSGKGFNQTLLEQGGEDWMGALEVGVRGMHERMRQLKRKLEIITKERGTLVRAIMPASHRRETRK